MKHLTPINAKGRRLAAALETPVSPAEPVAADVHAPGSPVPDDVVALMMRQTPSAHIPLGCSTLFSPGWEVDRTGGTAGLCQPVERDLFDCHLGCFWPVQVPDQLNHAPDWVKKCAAAQKDWRKIDIIFP